MPFTENLSAFLNVDEFATEAIYDWVVIYGIFNNGYIGVPVGLAVDIESAATTYICKTSDVSCAVHGELITINTIEYRIVGIQPDGTGITVLVLEVT